MHDGYTRDYGLQKQCFLSPKLLIKKNSEGANNFYIFRGNHQVWSKKGVLKNFAKLAGEQGLFFDKVAGQSATSLKREL